ncbi:669d54c3-0936-45ee-a914-0d85de7e1766 [Thermothielavioides terrestris]|uniref:Alpha-amylase n=1 Tax=Thermothielavioides terrestris TaxID=2587410 RepID=A0A3S5CVW2_9PEZI|nr:669d54c3-0936-45ee-a914-0d85de7e1766 [Thermothielavioides terrestris]
MRTLHRALLVLAGAVLEASQGAAGLSAAEWRSQSIYQVVTDRFARTDLSTTASCNTADQVYCGGTWQGLISKLDYIQGMGFTAVWISPVVKQVEGNSQDGSAYHGYWAQDIWALNPAFGTEADLAALAAALHARGMYLMVDIVTNHMAYMGCGTCVNYSLFNPFSSSSYFHPYCAIDYSNQTSVEVLPDLRTEEQVDTVRSIWNRWVSQLVSNYSIDGFRVDSAKHVETSFWQDFSTAAGVYLLGEVFDGDPSYVAPYQNYLNGVLDYPSYYWILRAFQSSSGSISDLVSGLNTLHAVALDLSLYGSFLENHDVARFASFTQDMAIAFTMLKDGIPIVYQGQEQHYAGGTTPNNREALWLSGYSTSSELYKWIAALNQIRARAIAQDSGYLSYSSQAIYSDSHTIAMRKGTSGYQIVGVFTNVGASSSATVTLTSSATGFGANQALIDVMSCTAYTTDSTGALTVTLNDGLPKVLYPTARLSGSGICPGQTSTALPTSSSTAASATTTASACSLSAVNITFNELVTTVWGDTIKLAGNISALGSWSPSSALTLSASQYSQSNPLWSVTTVLGPGTVIEYKFIKVSASGTVTWESDPNRVYAVPCATATVSSTWR